MLRWNELVHAGQPGRLPAVSLHGDMALSLNDDSAVESLIASASLCIRCLAAKSGLLAEDVEIALRVLLRTRSLQRAETCDSCRSGVPAFRTATH
jgi:hypothetical protein